MRNLKSRKIIRRFFCVLLSTHSTWVLYGTDITTYAQCEEGCVYIQEHNEPVVLPNVDSCLALVAQLPNHKTAVAHVAMLSPIPYRIAGAFDSFDSNAADCMSHDTCYEKNVQFALEEMLRMSKGEKFLHLKAYYTIEEGRAAVSKLAKSASLERIHSGSYLLLGQDGKVKSCIGKCKDDSNFHPIHTHHHK